MAELKVSQKAPEFKGLYPGLKSTHKYTEAQKPTMKELQKNIFKDAASAKTVKRNGSAVSEVETTYYNKKGEIVGSTRKMQFSNGSACTLLRTKYVDYMDNDNDGKFDRAYLYNDSERLGSPQERKQYTDTEKSIFMK